jgi:hypothetical protein
LKSRTELGERKVILDGYLESKFKALKLILEKIFDTNREKEDNNNDIISCDIKTNESYNMGLDLNRSPLFNTNKQNDQIMSSMYQQKFKKQIFFNM